MAGAAVLAFAPLIAKKKQEKGKFRAMDITTLILQQSTDIFRLGLLAGLIFTTERTRLQTGVVLPLIAGIIFVAIIIPATMPQAGVDMWLAASTGVFVNAVIVGLMWLGWQAYDRSKRSS
jgi:hypothetical protein